eukprot:scaffold4979_cov82-Isochrysis_galbana.AAC.3
MAREDTMASVTSAPHDPQALEIQPSPPSTKSGQPPTRPGACFELPLLATHAQPLSTKLAVCYFCSRHRPRGRGDTGAKTLRPPPPPPSSRSPPFLATAALPAAIAPVTGSIAFTAPVSSTEFRGAARGSAPHSIAPRSIATTPCGRASLGGRGANVPHAASPPPPSQPLSLETKAAVGMSGAPRLCRSNRRAAPRPVPAAMLGCAVPPPTARTPAVSSPPAAAGGRTRRAALPPNKAPTGRAPASPAQPASSCLARRVIDGSSIPIALKAPGRELIDQPIWPIHASVVKAVAASRVAPSTAMYHAKMTRGAACGGAVQEEGVGGQRWTEGPAVCVWGGGGCSSAQREDCEGRSGDAKKRTVGRTRSPGGDRAVGEAEHARSCEREASTRPPRLLPPLPPVTCTSPPLGVAHLSEQRADECSSRLEIAEPGDLAELGRPGRLEACLPRGLDPVKLDESDATHQVAQEGRARVPAFLRVGNRGGGKVWEGEG